MSLRAQVEPRIEVHKYNGWVVVAVAFTAIMLQGFLRILLHEHADLLELPLLVTLYFGLSRRNPSSGLLLGMWIGLFQDAVSGTFIGLYGIAKTLVGFAASSIGARIDVEHPFSRFLLTLVFFYAHQFVFTFTRRLLLAESEAFITQEILLASVVVSVLAVALFPLLDRLRRTS